MARSFRAFLKPLLASSSSPSSSSSSCKTLLHRLYQQPSLRTDKPTNCVAQIQSYCSELRKSPFESNILRILRTEIQYQTDYAPPHQPATKFNSFAVEDRPGEQWITLRSKFQEGEDIKIEVTMFDGCIPIQKADGDSTDLRLHISLLVDISKFDGCGDLEFLCSSWPDSLEIQKVYILRRDLMLANPYMGPNFRDLDRKLQNALCKLLEERGINDELSGFLHEYMLNKDRTEFVRWLEKLKSSIEK